MRTSKQPAEPIAIIGTGCRFPGSCDNPSKLWELLRDPRDLLKEITDTRFNADSFYHPDGAHHGTSNVRHSYLLEEDFTRFDNQFFGIKPVEAAAVDPQQRLLLETVYEGLESAGLSIKQLQGSDTAVYVGCMSADFTDMISRDIESFPTYFATGTARSILSNRLSHFFDWHGPSATIDTACSSSLVALHQAVQTLRSGESSLAVVAGSNLIIGPEQYIAESKLQMLSPTGRSRMWDAAADGYARGEGVAAVILKPLSRAVADGDMIECIVRETGLNQDGKTPGITMPSASAQAALIRSTYAKAGLDLSKPSDRPQYFEAHGTGTPAGDPVEAEAISRAFFGSDLAYTPRTKDEHLFVGSIKTVIGHTEGTAGVAGIIKGALALKSATVPPNRLFEQLNPAIKPFYTNLQIPCRAVEWPNLTAGAVRRVSVNSFGFGGANAHAILESYVPPKTPRAGTEAAFTPFTFSANSETTLQSNLASYRDYLSTTPDVNPRDLAWTLNERRSTLPCRVAFPATGIEGLIKNIDESLNAPEQPSNPSGTRKPHSDTVRILGIFTGQGAQWPRMGADLLVQSPGASRIVNELDSSLQQLPHRDRPTWTLRAQLLAPSSSSQVGTASISQPLCTAVQIMLVDLLRSAGIEFSAVVGHSSGEIGAAYAAGCISAGDAIRIAYYRGLHLKAATQQGSMMAVGTSFDDAKELCDLPSFEGHLCVAASNSSASVTLSGDTNAIEEARAVLDEEKKFTRLLKVDRAYHSHHMEPCVAPYVRSLRECKVQFRSPTQCRWISSVFTQNVARIPEALNEAYWGSNLAKPVMFSEALQLLLEQDAAIDMAIEVGPHPALKGPASQTIEASIGYSIPYTGVLSRGQSDIASFSAALGFMWSSFGASVVDFSNFDKFVTEATSKPKLLNGLPTYQWNHNRAFWHESRLSKAFRTRKDHPNELLGRQVLDGTPDQVRWRNVLRPKEIEWLDGHQVQGQMVFPCAGYVSACLEAVLKLCGSRTAQCIELQDFVVSQAITFSDSNSDVEILVTLAEITYQVEAIHTKFSFYSSVNSDTPQMTTNATCSVHATLGDADANLLEPKAEEDFSLLDVECDRFYAALEQLGFGYSGPFRALSDTKRKLGAASGSIHNASSNGKASSQLLIHPATLDAAIQSIMLAYCYPGDSMLRSIYLPTGISRLVVNPMHCLKFAGREVPLPFDSTASTRTTQSLQGNANIYAPDGSRAIQLESLQTRPLSTPTASNDLNIFTELVWGIDRPDQVEAIKNTELHKLNADLLFSLERVAYYYLKTLNATVPPSERAGLEWHHKRLFAYVDHVMSQASKGANRFARKEWMADTEETISQILDRYPDNIDLRLMRAVGENLPAVIQGSLTMLQPMMQDNMLNDFYVNAHGMSHYTQYLGSMAKQISHRYPHMNVLEIGAGTGGATKSFLKDLEDGFGNYTFTDISSGFFEKASEVFAAHRSKMTFQVLDIEKDIEAQGFASHSFDVIIASLVLHATKDLAATMKNVRRLLKPGGYLLLLEITENEQMRFGLIFGGLAGWWLGYDDGRILSPCVGLDEWATVLKETGFSGIDTAVPHHPELPVPLSVIASQAVDDRVECLRSPLAQPEWPATISRMTILGGGNKKSARLAKELKALLEPRCGNLTFLNSIDDIRPGSLPVGGTVLSLADIDEPILRSMDADRLRAFQEIFKQSGDILWITQGARAGDPYAKMIVGFGRTIVLEMLHLRLQLLDFQPSDNLDANVIAEAALRLELTGNWERKEQECPILHSVEPELCFTSGKMYVPRYKLNKEQNARYNCGRRNITHDVNKSEALVELVHGDGKFHLIEPSSVSHAGAAVASKIVEIDVLFSMTRAVEITDGCFLFPLFGTDKRTGGSLLALSATQSTRVSVPKQFVIPISAHRRGEIVLQQFYAELLVQSAMRHVPEDSQVVVLDPTLLLEGALDNIAKRKDYRIAKVTSVPTTTNNSIYLHPMASRAQIQHSLPENIACFLDLNEASVLSSRIRHCLSKFTKIRLESALSSIISHPVSDASADIRYMLMEIQYALERSEGHGDGHLKSLNLSELMGIEDTRRPYLIDWKTGPTVSIDIQPIEELVKFKDDHTYWLVGLTGGLGLSLCEWMSQQGARYIVISSRSPKVDQRWLDKMRSLGVTVMVVANDVSDGISVRTVHREICQKMPPIAGVVQGAMVLHDTMFSELNIQRMNKAITPKVKGSTHLEEIFYDTDLDFFVFFSSMAAVTGNPGQSAYAAANMFMTGLAHQRRSRGLNASAVHIGAIFGNGYVTRELTLTQQEFLRKVGNLWLSEHDFHRLFAEAIYAGQRDRRRNPELSTGLKMVEGDESQSITWFNNPIFQHCVKQAEQAETPSTSFGKGTSVKTRLLEAITQDDVYDIILDAFTAKLAMSMQVEGERSLVDLSAESLGIDSLIAVDIRSWFIKELQVEISVLKILGGATIGEMVLQAQELLPPDLTPKFNPNAKGKTPGLTMTEQHGSVAVTKGSSKKSQIKPDITPKKTTTALKGSESGPEEKNPRSYGVDCPRNIDHSSITDKIPATSATTSSSASDTDNSRSNIGPALASSPRTDGALSNGSSTSWSEVDESEAHTAWEPAIIPVKEKATTPGDTTKQVKRKLRMGFTQSGFWFLHKYIQDPSTFNITVSITLNGRLNVRKFELAVQTLGQRHEALRTRFVDDSSLGAVQEILADSGPRLEQRSILADDEAEMAYQELKQYAFKLDQGENMRIILLTRTASSHQLIIGYHHINMDGASLEVLLKDLQMAYNGQLLNQRPLQYADFAEEQRREYETGQWDDELSFWKNEFEDQPPPFPLLSMAKTSSRAPLTAYSSTFVDFHVDRTLQDSIHSICRKLKVTPFHFHLAVFYTVLIRLTDVSDICIGISSANRNREDVMQSVGPYLNLLPLRFRPRLDHTFTNILHTVRENCLAAFSHSKIPFDVLVNELGVPRSASHSPLFQVVVNYRAGISESRLFCDCKSHITAFEQGQSPYDLSLDVIDNPGDACHVIIGGQSALYDSRAMEIVKNAYLNLLTAFARNSALRLSVPSLYEKSEVKHAMKIARGPSYEYQWPATIPHRIDEIVDKYGDQVALSTDPEQQMTYREMDDRVNCIAAVLSTRGIGREKRVGVFMVPGTEWICSLLAILRLDATYIAFDPRLGLDRLRLISAECQPDLMLVDDSTESDAVGLGAHENTLNVEGVEKHQELHVSTMTKPDSVAVIAFTSGSTGTPKGIVMKHHTFRNNIESSTAKWYFREGNEVTLQQSAYSFDMSLSQIFLTLANGGTLRIVDKLSRGDPKAISSIITTEGITITEATPSEYISWLQFANQGDTCGSKWRVAVSGGEMVTDSLTEALRRLDKPELRLIDCYGPTETTFCSHSREVDYQNDASDRIAGFDTWPNYSVYIVDPHMKAMPVGVPGEILVGGAGVVSGYLRPELDAHGFVRDTLAPPEFTKNGWTRLHRTGDSGRLDDQGKLILGGRIQGDTQIKLRGMRIDLQEIENAIINVGQGSVIEAAVILRQSIASSADFLVAFVTVADNVDGTKLQGFLQQLPLPQFMVPATIVPLPKMPKSASNKLDRLALKHVPLPEIQTTTDEELQTDKSMSKMRKIWQTVLPEEISSQHQIAPDSDFFHVGGNSMLMVNLQSEIQKELGKSIALFELFTSSTLRHMSSMIFGPSTTPNDVAITLEDETAVSPDLPRTSTRRRFTAHPEVIGLTGATGFLGQAILIRLLKDCSVQKIHCLAVRRNVDDLPAMFKSPKVVVHQGDLTLPRLGLSEEAAREIFPQIDAVIHNGADVSFMKTYESLKPANLESTKEIVRLCLPHKVSLHYVSTASVAHFTGLDTFDESTVQDYPPPVEEGYIATKWASERYLEKVNALYDLPVWIHRPSSITREGTPENDLMANLLHYSSALKAVPTVELWKGWLDFVSADGVAMRLADEVYGDYSLPGTVKYLYESGEKEIPLSSLKAILERESGETFATLSFEDWISSAQAAGLHDLLASYLRAAAGTPVVFPRLQREESFL